jgi:hypothetical protein
MWQFNFEVPTRAVLFFILANVVISMLILIGRYISVLISYRWNTNN